MRRFVLLAASLFACGGTLANEAPAPLASRPVAPAFEAFWSSALETSVSASASIGASGDVEVGHASSETAALLRGPEHRLALGVIQAGEVHGAVAHRMQFLLLPPEVVDAALVGDAFCALRNDGKLRCAPVRGGAASDKAEIAVDPAATRLLALDADHLCVLRPSGEWACWLHEFSKWSEAPGVADELKRLGPGAEPVAGAPCAITRERKLVCFDKDGMGLGSARVVAEGVAQASVGAGIGDFAGGCAAKTDGSVACWGSGMNETGVSGDGKRGPHAGPWIVAGVHDAIAVARSPDHACALTKAHAVWCWGAADGWAYGDAALASATKFRTCDDGEAPGAGDCVTRPAFGEPHARLHLVPVRVPELEGITSIAAGYDQTCGTRADGRVLCVGGDHPGPWTIDAGGR